MMRKIQLCLFLFLVPFSTGCPDRPSEVFGNKNNFASNVNEYLATAQKRFEESFETDPNKAKRVRDDAIEDALAVIDGNYENFTSKLNSQRSATDFVADVIELGTSVATGISKGERPNQILGISLTGFRGVRKSGGLNFYKEQTIPILIAKMDDNRAQAHSAILLKKPRPASEYSLKEAIRDIVAYYNAGTLVRAFTQLSKDTAAQAKQSDKRVLELQKINPSDVVELTPDVTKAALIIGKHRKNYARTLARGSDEDKKEVTEKLRLIYSDVAKGAKSEMFKPVLEKLKQENPSLKADMVRLEAESGSGNVPGERTLEVLSSVLLAIDMQKQGDLMITLKEIYENRM
jgi:hypothetical protein